MEKKRSSDLGNIGEEQAASFLQKKGYVICERNYRVRGGELDIIAKIGNELVFIEVKARSSQRFGYPEEGVHFFKMKRIVKAIRAYLSNKRIPESMYLRFDVIAVEKNGATDNYHIHHIENIELPEIVW